MFRSVLIANRGEIACRIARTAKRLGLRTIGVYSAADANALHVRACDEAYAIGPASARESYLSTERILQAAAQSRAECIHPGYGFLSENADFAEACAASKIAFIGPSPEAIRAMGLKDRAKALMERAGVPVVPGYHGDRQDAAFLKQKAYEIGYPLLIKAVAGGGGRGMRRVARHADFDAALEAAMREAQAAFADARVLIERYVAAPRHIEFQIFGDRHGNVIHLNERDCSLQRRHQKIIEEAPAPGMSAALRARMGEAAVAAAKAVGYVGAGTVEFIVDGADGLRADGFWFMEMNTRLQVEHPVTEATTGEDLVAWQFRVAAGEALPLSQTAVPLRGHAVEARLYAEDPANEFLPSSGKLIALRFPQGVRVDSGVEAGDAITPLYDPMIAKVITHGADRNEALDRLARALDDTIVLGPRTNLRLLSALCRSDGFRSGDFDTGYIARHREALLGEAGAPDPAAAAAGVLRLVTRPRPETGSPWDEDDGFQLLGARAVSLPVLVDGAPMQARIAHDPQLRVTVEGAAPDCETVLVEDGAAYVLRDGRQTVVQVASADAAEADGGPGDGAVRAPMHGRVVAVLVEKGAKVGKGHRLAVIEAMKMEHAVTAAQAGVVADIAAEAGQQVSQGARLMTIAPDAEGPAQAKAESGEG
ncbi:MAG: biotin carboxylase N-terminal domain-containing protein [Pseudorhodoplanes sp.]